jgi:hypothetical protein
LWSNVSVWVEFNACSIVLAGFVTLKKKKETVQRDPDETGSPMDASHAVFADETSSATSMDAVHAKGEDQTHKDDSARASAECLSEFSIKFKLFCCRSVFE